ncbi:MAG: hypothetical protein HQM10_26990 [Candidatus Riflebacteria bacterium]|nr:hypothetical protein [Candidatus Riflebacteria bacterium]
MATKKNFSDFGIITTPDTWKTKGIIFETKEGDKYKLWFTSLKGFEPKEIFLGNNIWEFGIEKNVLWRSDKLSRFCSHKLTRSFSKVSKQSFLDR